MDLLPTSLGTRPRLAVEIRPEGVVAARAEDALAVVSAVAYGVLATGVLMPGLKAGNVVGRAAAVGAVRKVLEAVALRERQTTVVVPDAAVRVLLLDFDALPAKAAEALPVVRFRLKKLLPFDADDAVVSYQVMSTQRGMVRVLAVAAPKDVLAEYESVVREAGFEPGAVLPSTLAACAGMTEMEAAALLVNAGESSVTTAIVQGGVLLLHRTVDLAAEGLDSTAAQRDETAMNWAQMAERMSAATREVTQAVSVAAAYFEDTLQAAPGVVLAVGTLGAEALNGLVREAGFRDEEMRVREMIEPGMLTGGAVSARVPKGWMAGVRGALRS